jgi:hypothetical protein
MQLCFIEFLYVSSQPWPKGKDYKAKNLERVMHSVLALFKGGRVNLNEAWRVFSPKSSLTKHGVRTYTQCHA